MNRRHKRHHRPQQMDSRSGSRHGTVALFVFGILIISLCYVSCSSDFSPIIPGFDSSESLLRGSRPLAKDEVEQMEGVYEVIDGKDRFGDVVVLKWNEGEPTIFCNQNGAFQLLESGVKDGSVRFEGYWRYAFSLETGRVRITLAPEDGADSVLKNERPAGLVLRGNVGVEEGDLNEALTLKMVRRLQTDSVPDDFWIIGHRGGGRNSDFHPHSENSVEMIRFAHRLGCNGVEIDVQLTKDNVPVLFHDAELTTRLIRGDHLVGPISNYTYAQLRQFARLINGEQIPTLEEALKAAADETSLRFIWVDMKKADVIPVITPIIRKQLEKSKNRRIPLEIVMGMPTQEIYDAYAQVPVDERAPGLCEIGLEEARNVNAVVWASRWTLGLQADQVAQAHASGLRAFTWTDDLPYIIEEFISGGYDGVLSNYPTLVAWYYYTRENQ